MIIFDEIAEKVLSQNQKELKKLLEDFSKSHFLIGGTAIALQLGHRKSIDFDFINDKTQGTFVNYKKRIEKNGFYLNREETKNYFGGEFENYDEFHFEINNVRFSTFNYFRTLYDDQKINIFSDKKILGNLNSVSLEKLLCMKLFACITRNKWKDAVDIYFILQKENIFLKEALKKCEEKYFINIFNSEAVLEQLISGFWDNSESVEYILENPPKDEEIIDFLQKEAEKIIL